MSDSEKANQTARSIILPVDGMTCAACSRAVEQAIGRLDGVEPQLLQQRNQGGSAWKPEYGYASGDRLCRGISL